MRTKLMVALAVAGAFALAACSSNGAAGNPSPATTPSSSAPITSSAPGASSTSSAGGGATSSADGGGSTGQGSSEQGSSTTESTDQSTITVGGNVDAQTATWFSAFCSGMSPLLTAAQGGAMPTGGADMQSTMVKEFSTLGDALTNTANALKPLPPPTFTNGAQFASDVVNSLSQAGPQMKSAAQAIQAVDPTDTTGLETAIQKAGDSLDSSMSVLSKYDLDENTQTAMKSIPACAAFAAEADDTGSTTG